MTELPPHIIAAKLREYTHPHPPCPDMPMVIRNMMVAPITLMSANSARKLKPMHQERLLIGGDFYIIAGSTPLVHFDYKNSKWVFNKQACDVHAICINNKWSAVQLSSIPPVEIPEDLKKYMSFENSQNTV